MQKNININCISGFIKIKMTDKIDEKFKNYSLKIRSARWRTEDIANAVILASNLL